MDIVSSHKDQVANVYNCTNAKNIQQLLDTYSLVIINDVKFNNEEDLEEFSKQFGQTVAFGDWQGNTSTIQKVKKKTVERKAIGGWYYLGTDGFGDWHLDGVSSNRFYSHSVLYSNQVPGNGSGDTVFAFTPLALADLSDTFVNMLREQQVVHLSRPLRIWPQEHFEREVQWLKFESIFESTSRPLICNYKGIEGIYVSPSRSLKIDGMYEEESRGILDFLSKHIVRDEYCYRHTWKPNQLAIWNNTLSLHYPVNDYIPEERELWRICINYE
jgi:alpha-ketoglutarate-dependent taurine dioxygenase